MNNKPFILSTLPYDRNALAPVISSETVSYHYNKHHQGYVDKLNELVLGTQFEGLELETIVLQTDRHDANKAIFNNAAQVWNHDFYWKSLSPEGGGKPKGEFGQKLEGCFGSFEKFLEQFSEAGTAQFGSGWVWLVVDKGGMLKIVKTSNAENPMSLGLGKALLVLDVWEHAYYLDYQNRRKEYLNAVLSKLINWQFAQEEWGHSA